MEINNLTKQISPTCWDWANNRFTSAVSSSMVLIHCTTLSALPPTSTTRSVDWGQHSWKSLMVVWVLWYNTTIRTCERFRKKHHNSGKAMAQDTMHRHTSKGRFVLKRQLQLYENSWKSARSSPHAALWFWPPSHRWCCLLNSDESADATHNQSPLLYDADTTPEK